MDHRELQEPRVTLGQLEHPVRAVRQVHREHGVSQGHLGPRVCLDPKDPLEQEEIMELQVPRASEDKLAPLGTMEHLEHLDRQELVETVVSLELQGPRVFLVLLAQ